MSFKLASYVVKWQALNLWISQQCFWYRLSGIRPLSRVVSSVPDPYVFGPSGSVIYCTDPDPSISKQKIKENLDSYRSTVLWLLYDFFIFEEWYNINVPSKRNKHKNLEKRKFVLLAYWRSLTKRAGSGAESVIQRYGSEDLPSDPYLNVTDPERW